jgi:hypothetical protein
VYASLTLGGYDRNRIIPNEVLFPMAADNDRDLLVNINNITTDLTLSPNSTLLQQPVYAFIDSTISELWLPSSTCLLFEAAFNLTYDTNSSLYLVSDAQHDALAALNPNVTFRLSPAPEYGKTVDITLPYAAFDLTARPPYRGLSKSTRYFPLKRAENETQYTLGRVFLQEAYLTVDWEHQNFYVSQINWVPNNPQKITPMQPLHPVVPAGNRQGTPKSLETGTIAGIVVAIVALAAIIVTLSILLFRSNRRSKREREAKKRESAAKSTDDGSLGKDGTAAKAELDASDAATRKVFEKDSVEQHQDIGASPIEGAALQEAPSNAVFELPGDVPSSQADGRELSEKEAMRIREARYNGVEQPRPFNTKPLVPMGPLPINISHLSPADKKALQKARRHSLIGPVPPPPHPPPRFPLPPTPASPLAEPGENPSVFNGPTTPVTNSAGASQFSPVSPVTPGTSTSHSGNTDGRLTFVSPVSATEGRSLAAELAAPHSTPGTFQPSAEPSDRTQAMFLSDNRLVDKRSSDSKINMQAGRENRFSWEK